MGDGMKIVKVIWEDAASTDDWIDTDHYKLDANIVETVGYLFKETTDHVVIMSSVVLKADQGTSLMQIPRSTVREIVELAPKPQEPNG